MSEKLGICFYVREFIDLNISVDMVARRLSVSDLSLIVLCVANQTLKQSFNTKVTCLLSSAHYVLHNIQESFFTYAVVVGRNSSIALSYSIH